jgi:hypothetical protein
MNDDDGGSSSSGRSQQQQRQQQQQRRSDMTILTIFHIQKPMSHGNTNLHQYKAFTLAYMYVK